MAALICYMSFEAGANAPNGYREWSRDRRRRAPGEPLGLSRFWTGQVV
jgi:hypothetical protein